MSSQIVKAAGIAGAPNKLIAAMLVPAHVLHADETATCVADAKAWLHVACTDKLALFTLAPRSKAGAESGGVLPGFRGTMVHDALWLYRGFPEADHQLCVAHVVRELTACDERFPGQVWAPQIRWALAEVIKEADKARAEGLDHAHPSGCAAGPGPRPTRVAAPLGDLLRLRPPGWPGASPRGPAVGQAEQGDEPPAAPARLQGRVPALHQ